MGRFAIVAVCAVVAAGMGWGLARGGDGPTTKPDGSKHVAVVFSGGHETDGRDGGRPVILIAAALKVKPEVFRAAFSGVHPARGGGPSGQSS